jgi:hypothetical protein
MKTKTKEDILDDWEDFVAPVFKKEEKTWLGREKERHRRQLKQFRRWRRR